VEGDRGGRLASDSGKATRERHQLTEKKEEGGNK
jgi:hypothetical protein